MDNNESKIKELQEQLAAVTNERDTLSAELAEIKNGGFSFESAMQRIKAKEADAELYRQQMQEAFAQPLSTTTKYI